jgi:hypothetical protein
MCARGDCFYLTRLTVSEDGAYLPAPDGFHDWFTAEAPAIAEVNSILRAYHDILHVDLLGELKQGDCSAFPGDKRTIEAGIYAAAAHFLEKVLNLEPSCVAFYSSGVAPALIYTNVVSARAYLADILPFHVANRRAYAEAGEKFNIAQVRLEVAPNEDLESFIISAIRSPRFADRVYVKDRRHHHTILIAGDEVLVKALNELACSAFPSAGLRNPRVNRTSSAHLPFYDCARLVRLLDHATFHPPRVPLIGVSGEEVPAGADDQKILRDLVVNAAAGFLDTGRVVRTAAKYATTIRVVGSALGARVLRRTGIGGYPTALSAIELAMQTAAGRSAQKRHLAKRGTIALKQEEKLV